MGNLLVMYQGVVTASTVVIERQNGAKYLDSSLEAFCTISKRLGNQETRPAFLVQCRVAYRGGGGGASPSPPDKILYATLKCVCCFLLVNQQMYGHT